MDPNAEKDLQNEIIVALAFANVQSSAAYAALGIANDRCAAADSALAKSESDHGVEVAKLKGEIEILRKRKHV